MSGKLTPSEQEALENIRDMIDERGKVYQSDLHNEMDWSDGWVSEIIKRLEEKNVIEREEVTAKGHVTYLLTPKDEEEIEQTTKKEQKSSRKDRDLKKEVLEILEDVGVTYQSDLWKELDTDSSTMSDVVRELEDEEEIEREKTTKGNITTYRVKLKGTEEPEEKTKEEERKGKTLEEGILDVLEEDGEIYQSEIQDLFETSSGRVSETVQKLEDDGKIERIETTHNGYRTYLIVPRGSPYRLLINVEGELSPTVGIPENEIDPLSPEISKWIQGLPLDNQKQK